MKRKFDSSISDRSSRGFGNVRHNLLADFGDTPLKSARLTFHNSGGSNLFSNVSATSLNGRKTYNSAYKFLQFADILNSYLFKCDIMIEKSTYLF